MCVSERPNAALRSASGAYNCLSRAELIGPRRRRQPALVALRRVTAVNNTLYYCTR